MIYYCCKRVKKKAHHGRQDGVYGSVCVMRFSWIAKNSIQKRLGLCTVHVDSTIELGPGSNVVQLNEVSFQLVHLVQLFQPIVNRSSCCFLLPCSLIRGCA